MKNDALFCVGQKAFIEKDGKVLILGDPTEGLDFPGGKIQDGEAKDAELLLQLSHFLQLHQLTLNDISSVGVMVGPASYTTLRIAVTTANTIAWSLGVSLFGIKVNDIVPDCLPLRSRQAKVGIALEPIYPSKL